FVSAFSSLRRGGGARLLVQDRLHPRRVATDASHLARVLQLAGGTPEAEVEGLLLQRLELLAQLIRRLVPQIRSFHLPDPFRPKSRIWARLVANVRGPRHQGAGPCPHQSSRT